MKIGDRVWVSYCNDAPDDKGFGVIKYIWRGTYDVVLDGDNPDFPFYVEPDKGDIIIPETVYKSKLYKVLE